MSAVLTPAGGTGWGSAGVPVARRAVLEDRVALRDGAVRRSRHDVGAVERHPDPAGYLRLVGVVGEVVVAGALVGLARGLHRRVLDRPLHGARERRPGLDAGDVDRQVARVR